MSDKRTLIVGLDLGQETTQISFLNQKNNLVESIFVDQEKQENSIPTALAVTQDGKEWLIGKEALDYGHYQREQLLEGFLYKKETEFEIRGTRVSKLFILEKYLRKVLLLLKREFPEHSILKLVVTIKELDVELIEQLYQALAGLGIHKDRVRIISHARSYLYFALSQKKELWMNDVALFDLDEDGLMYYQISVDRRNRPMVVALRTKAFNEVLAYEMVQNRVEGLEYIFENIASSVMHKQIISTIYLTGKGFYGDWIRPSLKSLCSGRRVFIGQNLYCFGACYAAREDAFGEYFSEFAFLSEESLPISVSMKVYSHAMNGEMILIPTAIPWYEAKKTIHVILEDEEELQFTIRDIAKRTSQTRIISLDGLDHRMEKGTRLEIRLDCVNNQALVITVKDLGFGDICPSTNRIWEQVITV